MTHVGDNPRADRTAIEKFIAAYSRWIEVELTFESYPEDVQETPSDARIDAIYQNQNGRVHLEHTSIDLIASGRAKKRVLDPGFLHLESELKKIDCPVDRGVVVFLPIEYARNIPRLKSITPSLLSKVSEYIRRTGSQEWYRYPREYDFLDVEGWRFPVCPDVFHGSFIQLEWAASAANFLSLQDLEEAIANLIPSKIAKLDRSTELDPGRRYSVLIVETGDVAAKSFHFYCGMFARVVAPLDSEISEIWGIRGNHTPVLVWSAILDIGRLDCAYCDDTAGRNHAQIRCDRMAKWKDSRQTWFGIMNYEARGAILQKSSAVPAPSEAPAHAC